MTQEERALERKKLATYLAAPEGEALVLHLRRRWRDGPPGESEPQMLNRLGRLDALADIERLREEAKGT